mmetsp:Transcript_145900/g.254526  ORF Transcript_145900/g.254526 Transcript_145900/m.254526 type:complete len:199 (-) Transcript_145900:87-683(-)
MQTNNALQRGQTAVEVNKMKAQFGTGATLIMLGASTIGIIIGVLYVFAGKTVDDKMVDACEAPWGMWYKVEGALTVIQGLLGIKVFMDMRTLMLSDSGDALLKQQYYAKEGRAQEAKQQAFQLQQDSSATSTLMTVALESCGVCCVVCFDLGWMIWGLIMYFTRKPECDDDTHYLIYLWLASICITSGVQIFKKVTGM